VKDIRTLFADAAAKEAAAGADRREADRRAREAAEGAELRGIPAADVARVALSCDARRTPALVALLDVVARRARRSTSGAMMVLSGPASSGKTCAGCWLLMRCYSGARRFTAAEVAGVSDGDFSDHVELRAAMREPRVVLLDDVGRERASPRDAARVIGYALDRAAAGLFTVLATSLTSDAFLSRYVVGPDKKTLNPRVADMSNRQRAELGVGWWFDLPAVDYRDGKNLAGLQVITAPPNPTRAVSR
jgi:hypothetical protein